MTWLSIICNIILHPKRGQTCTAGIQLWNLKYDFGAMWIIIDMLPGLGFIEEKNVVCEVHFLLTFVKTETRPYLCFFSTSRTRKGSNNGGMEC